MDPLVYFRKYNISAPSQKYLILYLLTSGLNFACSQIIETVNMVRKLKYHEKKLLKKVDFISWEVDNNLHEVKVMRKYHIQKREDYTK